MSDATDLPPDGEPRRARPQQNKGFAQSVAFSAARGALLIGVAVVIGIVLLQVVDNDTTGPIGDGGSNGGAVVDTSSTTAPTQDSTTTTAAQGGGGGARQPAEISVQVLNGSGVSGAAATMTTQLQGAGYVMLEPTDTSAATGTTVYCTGGLEAEASTLAAAVGGDPPPGTEALPDPPPSGTDSTTNCVVVLGS